MTTILSLEDDEFKDSRVVARRLPHAMPSRQLIGSTIAHGAIGGEGTEGKPVVGILRFGIDRSCADERVIQVIVGSRRCALRGKGTSPHK